MHRRLCRVKNMLAMYLNIFDSTQAPVVHVSCWTHTFVCTFVCQKE